MLDMETNPEKAIARAEAFNAQKVPVCVGTTLVGASSEIFEKNKLPVVASIMTINAVMDQGIQALLQYRHPEQRYGPGRL